MMGGTFLRQHNLIFDIDKNQVGFAHAICFQDDNQIKSEPIITVTDSLSALCNHTIRQLTAYPVVEDGSGWY
jgi:hypothetical protein